ncbi:hypothetical protein OG792_27645 [Micromonospora sp. NBC_01699]|uniref:hypothetical protein n=1 Tax=Micromonospora sp. NBC_01699 TaxID=2975984 RepID=UPI002E35A657|nr:hypothetical protein [Micromonospora sp. NBC_01699]
MAHAERGMSAPPEVVFNTATDPDRVDAWLPAPLRRDGGTPAGITDPLGAHWRTSGSPTWSARLQVRPGDAGGASVRLELAADPQDRGLDRLADESLVNLAREVADNLTPG